MAYTKYSLTPANNNAAPPDGAPEGMLPSAVNDTMRDMMAQIRDVGDGIRGGTYTMTAPVITGGSITGSTINNSAIGGTTAAAGAFTTLGATGVATFSAGTVSAPAITTTGDTNTGIFFPAADTIAFTEGGVEAMRITSAGNLGIGTSTAGSKLTVAGASSIYNSTNANTGSGYVLSITGNSNKSTATDNVNFAIFTNDALASNPLHLGVGLIGNATPANGYAYLQASQYGTGNFNNIALNPSGGNVGIGTSSPTAKLDVSSSSAGVTAGDFVVDTANKTVFVGRQSSTDGDNSNFIVKNRAGIEVMKVDASTQTVKTRLTISVGDATPASTGAGITFPATQSASSDANTLDDYEEGDFTPSITQGNTYSVRVGRYTKIGRVVNFYLNIECTITTGGGVQMSVSGLPFTVLNTSNLFFPCSVFAHTGWFVTSSTAIQAQIAPNTTEIYMFGFQNSTGQNYLVPTTSTCGGTVFIELAGSYQTT